MHRLGVALACLVTLAGWARAASPDPADLAITPEVQVKTRLLVERLGSDDYLEREDAQQQLASLGRLARPALLHGVNTSENPEVRLRCAELLPAASELDLRARIETFLADTRGEYDHDLPAWNTFRAAACREWAFFGHVVWSNRAIAQAAREVFVELIASPDNRRLMMAVEGSRVVLADLAALRRFEFMRSRSRSGDEPTRSPSVEDVAVLLFAESIGGSQYFPRGGSISFLMNSSGFTTAARGTDPKSQVYRAVAVAWLNSRNDPREMYQAMNVANSLDLADASCEISVRLLTMPGVTAMYRGRAATNLLNYGGKRHIRLLEKATASTTVVYTLQTAPPTDTNPEPVTHEIQLRDLALAVSILLAEQKLEDFDFTDRYGGRERSDWQSYSYTRYYFRDDEARKKSFAKWAEWRKAHADD